MHKDSFTTYTDWLAVITALEAQVLPANKTALFAALATADIHTVVVRFDGAGDEGQIEEIDGYDAARKPIQLPDTPISFHEVDPDLQTIVSEQRTIRECVESMAYELLGLNHAGWGNEDGAFGEFTFVVANQTIKLDYNERHVGSTNHQHEF